MPNLVDTKHMQIVKFKYMGKKLFFLIFFHHKIKRFFVLQYLDFSLLISTTLKFHESRTNPNDKPSNQIMTIHIYVSLTAFLFTKNMKKCWVAQFEVI